MKLPLALLPWSQDPQLRVLVLLVHLPAQQGRRGVMARDQRLSRHRCFTNPGIGLRKPMVSLSASPTLSLGPGGC